MDHEDAVFEDDLKMAPQTAAKHRILRHYLDAWYPILGTRRKKLLYFDGFAGSGRYRTGELGSPLIALDALLTRRDADQILSRCGVKFVFCEATRKHAGKLRERVAARLERHGARGRQVAWEVANARFSDVVQRMIEELAAQRSEGAPTLALVDPYGVKDIRMDQLAELLSFDGCELIFNFAIQSATRWTDHDAFEEHLGYLLGTDAWRDAQDMDVHDRRAFLSGLCAEQLRTVAGFEHVQSFRMWSLSGQPSYDLVYATRHPTGMSKMKEAMWRVDPGGGYEFRARFEGQHVLFSGAAVDTDPLRDALLARFAGQTVPVTKLAEFVVTETPYLQGHLKTRTLKPMELEHIAAVTVPGRERRKGSFPDDATVTFRPR